MSEFNDITDMLKFIRLKFIRLSRSEDKVRLLLSFTKFLLNEIDNIRIPENKKDKFIKYIDEIYEYVNIDNIL